MNGLAPSPAKYRSVTERLSDRCDILDARIKQLNGNCEWLKRECDKQHYNTVHFEQRLSTERDRFNAFIDRSFWQRLKWLVRGV